MTVTTVKVGKIANTALALLQREIVIPSLVTTNASGDFAGALNDTITIRVPARTRSKSRDLRPADENARRIQLSDLNEKAIQVTLDEDIYNAVGIEDEVATLDVRDFGEQVLAPQIRAVAEGWENKLAGVIESAPYVHEIEFKNLDKPSQALVEARKLLGQSDVPLNGRRFLVGSEVEAMILNSAQFSEHNQIGNSADSAIREATIGRIGGQDIVVSNAIDPYAAYLFHPTAFAAAWRAPVVPKGASFGQSVSAGSTSLTWLCDYDAMVSRDRSIVHVYTGANFTDDPADPEADNAVVRAGGLIRAVKINLAGGGS